MYLNRYATASARSDGLLLLCGGRDANSVVSCKGYSKSLIIVLRFKFIEGCQFDKFSYCLFGIGLFICFLCN